MCGGEQIPFCVYDRLNLCMQDVLAAQPSYVQSRRENLETLLKSFSYCMLDNSPHDCHASARCISCTSLCKLCRGTNAATRTSCYTARLEAAFHFYRYCTFHHARAVCWSLPSNRNEYDPARRGLPRSFSVAFSHWPTQLGQRGHNQSDNFQRP